MITDNAEALAGNLAVRGALCFEYPTVTWLHATSKHLSLKLEKYPMTVRKIKKRKETIKADYTKAPLVWLSMHPLWQNISPLHTHRQFTNKT